MAPFLYDENRETLTDGQRIFARECYEEIKACYQSAVLQMSQRGEMMYRHLMSDPEEYYRVPLS